MGLGDMKFESVESVRMPPVQPTKEKTYQQMVQIPLEEYKSFIISEIREPTVEISLGEYNYLKKCENKLNEMESHKYEREIRLNEREKMQMDLEPKLKDIINKVEQSTEKIINKMSETSKEEQNGIQYPRKNIREQ